MSSLLDDHYSKYDDYDTTIPLHNANYARSIEQND